MNVNSTYVKSAIETLNLIRHLLNYLKINNATNKLPELLSQIEAKASANVGIVLGDKLGIDIPILDEEGDSPKNWEGIRDMAILAKREFLLLDDEQKFNQFLKTTSSRLSHLIGSPQPTTGKLVQKSDKKTSTEVLLEDLKKHKTVPPIPSNIQKKKSKEKASIKKPPLVTTMLLESYREDFITEEDDLLAKTIQKALKLLQDEDRGQP